MPWEIPLAPKHPRPRSRSFARTCERRSRPALPDPRQQAIYFELGQTDVSDTARAELAELVRQLDLASVEWNLALTGHTDASGSAVINQRISAQRAQAVRDALEQLGVPAASISMAPSAAANTSPPPLRQTLPRRGGSISRPRPCAISKTLTRRLRPVHSCGPKAMSGDGR
ncbi:MAG: OmpA family protein [Brevundimonas sp.]|nr:MAG: OmpA family protein [Brevundimonas sp.]